MSKNKSPYYQEPAKHYNNGRFLKSQKKQIEKSQSFTETVQTWWTNLKYKVSSSFNSQKQEQDIQPRNITILGKKYHNRKEGKKAVSKVFWFTYRNKLNIKNQYSSDVGWGCLVRVGQMAIASGLQKFLQKNAQFGKAQQLNIIYACVDKQGKQQKYSLNKFVGQAEKQLNHKVGEWFDLSKICYTLAKLHNKNPLKGTQKLKIVYFDQILQIKTILTIQQIKLCQCSKPRIKCDICYFQLATHTDYSISNEKIMNNQPNFGKKKKVGYEGSNHQKLIQATKTVNFMEPFFKKSFKNDLMVIIVSQVSFGQNSEQKQASRNAIFRLLDLQISVGILTGFPKKAIYVIGRQQQELIYLDPHFVQKHVSKNLQQQDIDSFFCSDYNKTAVQKLDPSLAFAFYLRSLNDLDTLYKTISDVNIKFKGRIAIGCDWKYCSFQEQDFVQDNDDRVSDMSFFAP